MAIIAHDKSKELINNNAKQTLKYFNLIDEMIESGKYYSSNSFLESIIIFIEERDYITPRQMEAVDSLLNDGATPF